jgi:phosphoribosylanthranilate isomerase
MELIVKICGLSSEETVDAALDAGADMIGLVFFPPSPRFVSPARAAALAERARGRAEVAALTVDMDEAGLAAIVEAVQPDWLQFHGKETPEAILSAKKRFGRRVIKALGVGGVSDLAAASSYSASADRLLIDAKPPKGAILPGGNGEPFDWMILTGFAPSLPFMLSGGLDAGNIATALNISRAAGVDVSSGVETAPGRKDPELIRAFIAAARHAAASLPRSKTPERAA